MAAARYSHPARVQTYEMSASHFWLGHPRGGDQLDRHSQCPEVGRELPFAKLAANGSKVPRTASRSRLRPAVGRIGRQL
jgi:hypothetical protein